MAAPSPSGEGSLRTAPPDRDLPPKIAQMFDLFGRVPIRAVYPYSVDYSMLVAIVRFLNVAT